MATSPVQASDWIAEYKAALPKTQKDANKIRNNLRYVIGVFLFTPLMVLVIAFIFNHSRIAVEDVLVPGFLDAVLIVALFIGLGLYQRNPSMAVLRSAAFVLCSFALSFIDMGLVVKSFVSADLSASDSEAAVALSSVFSGSLWLIAAGLILRSRVRFFERGKAIAAYLPITREVAKELWHQVDEINCKAAALGLGPLAVSAWLSRTSSELLPSVCTSNGGGTSNLLIPRPFLRLLQENQERASAILAHELSHFYQNDANLWAVTDLFFAVLRRTALPLLSVNAVIIGVMSFMTGTIPNITGTVVLLGTIISSQRVALAARRKSEFRADQFASHVSNREALIATIQDYTSDDSPLHPTRRERIAALDLTSQTVETA